MGNKAWKLKDVLLCAIFSVLFGVIFLGATYLGGFVSGLLLPFGWGPMGYEPFYGIYFMAAAFAAYVIRKPGAGVIAEVMGAVIETMMGNFFGPIVILSGLVQGLGFEALLFARGYRRVGYGLMAACAVLCSVLTMAYNIFFSGYGKIALPVLAAMLAVRIVSAVIFDALLTKKLADSLTESGVLRGYAAEVYGD